MKLARDAVAVVCLNFETYLRYDIVSLDAKASVIICIQFVYHFWGWSHSVPFKYPTNKNDMLTSSENQEQILCLHALLW